MNPAADGKAWHRIGKRPLGNYIHGHPRFAFHPAVGAHRPNRPGFEGKATACCRYKHQANESTSHADLVEVGCTQVETCWMTREMTIAGHATKAWRRFRCPSASTALPSRACRLHSGNKSQSNITYPCQSTHGSARCRRRPRNRHLFTKESPPWNYDTCATSLPSRKN